MPVTLEQIQTDADAETLMLLKLKAYPPYLHDLFGRVKTRLAYEDERFKNRHDTKYQSADLEEKVFRAVYETFEEAYQRVLHPPTLVTVEADPFSLQPAEAEKLDQPVHPLLELALLAWEFKPKKLETMTHDTMQMKLGWMLRRALVETQKHIEPVDTITGKADIILQTQRYILETAIRQAERAQSRGVPVAGTDAEDMTRLAFNLLSPAGERRAVRVFNDQTGMWEGGGNLFSDCVLQCDGITVSRGDKLGFLAFPGNQLKGTQLPAIDLVETFQNSIAGKGERIDKATNDYVIYPSAGNVQRIMIRSLLAEQSKKVYDGNLLKQPMTVAAFIRINSQNVASNAQRVLARILTEYPIPYSQKFKLPMNDGMLRVFMQQQLQTNKTANSTLLKVLTNIAVDRKLAIVQPSDEEVRRGVRVATAPDGLSWAAYRAQQTFDDTRAPGLTQFLDIKALVQRLGSTQKALEPIFKPEFRDAELLTLLYHYNAVGAANHVAVFKTNVLSALSDLGRRVYADKPAAQALAEDGTLAADSSRIGLGKQIGVLLDTLMVEDKAITANITGSIKHNENQNIAHALKTEELSTTAIPSHLLMEKGLDTASASKRRKAHRDYLENVLDYLNADWTRNTNTITRHMWEVQRVMLELLADPLEGKEEMTIGGKQYVLDKELMNELTSMVVTKTVHNLSVLLEIDAGKDSEHNFTVFCQMASITVPYMALPQRESLVRMYTEKAVDIDGNFVRNGHLQTYMYAIALWDPEILKDKQGPLLTFTDKGVEYRRQLDVDLAPIITTLTLEIIKGWGVIDGITSDDLFFDFQKTALVSVSENALYRKAVRKAGITGAVNIMRNLSINEAKKPDPIVVEQNLKLLQVAVMEAVQESLKRVFLKELPPGSKRAKGALRAAELEVKRAEQSLHVLNPTSDANKQEITAAFNDLISSLKERLATVIPDTVEFPTTERLLTAMSSQSNRALIESHDHQGMSQAIEKTARVTGEAVSAQVQTLLASQTIQAVGNSNSQRQITSIVSTLLKELAAQATIIEMRYTAFFNQKRRLDDARDRMYQRQNELGEAEARYSEYFSDNLALDLVAFFNKHIVDAGLSQISLPHSLMVQWAKREELGKKKTEKKETK